MSLDNVMPCFFPKQTLFCNIVKKYFISSVLYAIFCSRKCHLEVWRLHSPLFSP